MANPTNSDSLEAAAALAGAAVIAAGVWKIFEQASDTVKSFITSKDKADAQNLYTKALQYQNQGIHNEAIRLFREVLKKDPTHSPAHNSIAWFYAINNIALNEAEKHAHSSVKFANNISSRSASIDTLAEIYLRQNKIQEAIVTFQNCLILQKRLESYYRLSWCYQLNQNNFEAYNSLIEAANLQQTHFFDIYQRLGIVCLELGRYSEAVKHFKLAFDLSSHQICYGLTDWGTGFRIPNGEALRTRRCESLLGLGLAHFRLKDIINSKSCWQSANKVFPNHPYPVFNLACIASRFGDKHELHSLLEILMPLIVDKSYAFDPPNISNKVTSFSERILVEQLLGHPDLEIHQDILLEVLRAYGKITEYTYRGRIANYQEKLRAGRISRTEESRVSINIQNSTVGGFAVGDSSKISSEVISQNLPEMTPESVMNFSEEIDDLVASIIQNNTEANSILLELDPKRIASPNDLRIGQSSDSSSSSAHTVKNKLHRST